MKPTTPRSLDWIDSAPLAVTRIRRIAAPPETVWEFIADHAGWAEWFSGIRSVDLGTPSIGVGGTRTVHLGAVSVAEEFLAWDPGAHFAFTVTGSTKAVIRSLVENLELSRRGPDATEMSYTMAIDPVGGRIATAVLRPLVGQVLSRGLAGLARVAETEN